MMDGNSANQMAPISAMALDRLMPLYVWISPTGHVREAGATMRKLCEGRALAGARFLEVFEMTRPAQAGSMAELAKLAGRRLHLRLREAPKTAFRGVAMPLGSGQGMIVNLGFGIGLGEAVRRHALTDADFAPTDLAVEMIYIQEAKSAVMAELTGMNGRLATARAAAEEQALTDPLTGLANRRALELALDRAAEASALGGQCFSLIHIDLDFFKAVNDTLGHAAGDHVLIQVARVLREETRRQDMVARVGGDEFVLIMRGMTEPEKLQALSRRIITRFEEPIAFGEAECRISGSAGVTISPNYDPPDPDRMLSDADLALYASKRAGRARCTLYSPGLEAAVDQRDKA